MGFMRGLEGRNRTEAIALVQLIREQGISFGGLTRALSGGGLFELRGKEVRLFYMFLPNRSDAQLQEGSRASEAGW